MSKVGIVCDTRFARHHLFESYQHAVLNLYGETRTINSVKDLRGIQLREGIERTYQWFKMNYFSNTIRL